jgi:hypothetical protein
MGLSAPAQERQRSRVQLPGRTLDGLGLHPSSHQPRHEHPDNNGPAHSSAAGSGLVWSLTSPDADKPGGGASGLPEPLQGPV